MALQNMRVFNDFAYGTATETIQQQVEVFNSATRGAITLVGASNGGDFNYTTMFEQISGLVKNRDAYDSSTTLTPVDLAQLGEASVKIGGTTELVRYQQQQFDWINQDQQTAGTAYGTQVAQAMLQYMLNSAIAGARAAVAGIPELQTDGTAGNASLNALNTARSKFGDQSGRIAAWIMHSKPKHDIYGSALSNAERLFEFGTVQVTTDGHGNPLIATDSPNLMTNDGGGVGVNWYHTLGVVPGGIMIEDNGNMTNFMDQNIEKVNAETLMKTEFDFNLGVKGYSWDGVKSPNDAEIATQANWDRTATDAKNTALVELTTL